MDNLVEQTQELRIENESHLLQFHRSESNLPVATSQIRLRLLDVYD